MSGRCCFQAGLSLAAESLQRLRDLEEMYLRCADVSRSGYGVDFHSAGLGWRSEQNQVPVIHSLFLWLLFRACLSTHILGIIAESERFLRRCSKSYVRDRDRDSNFEGSEIDT